MLNARSSIWAALLCAIALAPMAWASLDEDSPLLTSGTRVSPELKMVIVSDSNFYYSNGNEESVNAMIIEPGFRLESNTRRSSLVAGARAEIGVFDYVDQDDYVDSHVFGSYKYRAGTRHRMRLSMARKDDHDDFGRRRTENAVLRDQKLDEYRHLLGDVGYRYGAINATFNLDLGLNYLDREYTTNRELGTQFLDYESVEQVATIHYNISPKTSLLFRAAKRDISYDEVAAGVADRSAVVESFLIGGEWFATGKTSGRVLIGSRERSPDSDQFENHTAVGWSVNVEWKPRATSKLSFTTSRKTDESFLINSSFIDSRSYRLSWNQKWSPLWSSNASFTYKDQRFEDVSREDDIYITSVRGIVRISSEIDLFGEYSFTDRDSSLPARIYDKHVFQVGFQYRR